VLEDIVSKYPDRIAFITYHTWWPSPSDPYYQANIPENTDRINYYGADYTPHVYLDGIIDAQSGGPWEQMILDRATVESPLRIELAGDPGASTITATITNTSGAAVSGKLHFVIIENELAHGGHPWGHVMRDFFPAVAGEDITLAPSESIVRTETFALSGTWLAGNLEAVVYVQNDGTKEVYQSANIYFALDQPELLATAFTTDDSGGGDGNGRLDPGEAIEYIVGLTNLNPPSATGISGVLSSTDPHITISDASGTWPAIPQDGFEENSADPFALSVAPDTPWGYEIPVQLTLSASGGYSKVVALFLGVGSPEHPMGPDSYGYFAYENGDDYPPTNDFDWIEINPGLGGSGTLVTLGDDQTVTRVLPFAFKLYGVTSDRLSICSNGFVALGTTTNRDNNNGDIPGEAGPPSMIAAFWTDLDPIAAGGGKVYEWYDAAAHRYIVEFSGVEHYADGGGGVAETFQFVLYDPAFRPTTTGDGEVVLQYLTVSDPSSCSIGIEDQTETVGTEYLAAGHLNAAARGLVSGRAITFTTVGPDGIIAVGDPSIGPSVVRLVAEPNPFRSGTTFDYEVPTAGRVTLRLFDASGSVVRTVLDGFVPVGHGAITWDGRDDRGARAPAGVYFYGLDGRGFSRAGKVVRLP